MEPKFKTAMKPNLAAETARRPLSAVRVSAISEISPEAFVLTFPRQGDFRPGQVLAVTVDRELPARLFSICSGTGDAEVSILFDIRHGGLLSPRLATLRAGDRLFVSAPFGSFMDRPGPAWWIAAGTGIAPFRAMLRSGPVHDKHLVHGGRTADRFFFAEELQAKLGDRYRRCCSRESGPGLHRGRLTGWLRDRPTLPPQALYYLCGSAEMVVEVRDILIGRGITIDKIMSEIYF